MGNRIIKDSIFVSEKVNKMTDFQFRLWVSLITYVDDYGRGDARPAVIRGKCFPLRERLALADIRAALQKLADIGCISLYEVDGQSYLCLPNWESHQRIRTKKQKCPAPPENKQTYPHYSQSDSNLQQIAADCSRLQQAAANCGLNPNTNTNTNTKGNPNPNILLGAPQTGAPEPDAVVDVEPVILTTGEEWRPTTELYDSYVRLYPGVDIVQEFRKMHGWCIAKPRRRKTPRGVLAFVNSWLSRAQDSQNAPPRASGAYVQDVESRMSAVDDWVEYMKNREGED